MLICFVLSDRAGTAIPERGTHIEGTHSRLTCLRFAEDGPFYPHLAEQTTPDGYRFFAGRLAGVSPSVALPADHPVSSGPADDWSFHHGEPDGSWIALKYDGSRDTLSVASDVFNVQRWFYCRRGAECCIANSLRFLQQALREKAGIEEAAVPYMLQWGYLPGQLTPLKDVFELDAGEVLTVIAGRVSVVRRRALPVHRRIIDQHTDYPTAISDVMVEAVRREVQGLNAVMLPLSGGTDSRFLLGCLLETMETDQITALTFGASHSLDMRIGCALAGKMGIRSVRLEKDMRPVGVLMTENFPTSEGMYWTVPDYPVHAFRTAVPREAFLVSGYIGDPVFGSKEKGPEYESSAEGQSARLRAAYYQSAEVAWELVRPLLAAGDSDPMGIAQTYESLPGATMQEKFDFWYFGPHTTNRTHYAVSPVRDRCFFLTPFIHGAVLDQAFSLPPVQRRQRQAYFAALQRRFPELYRFPTTNNFGFPLSVPEGLRIHGVRTWRKLWADLDRWLGPMAGTIVYHHPVLVYNHPRELMQKIHRKDLLECFAELKSLAVFRTGALDTLAAQYRKRVPLDGWLLRGLLTVHQWLRNYQ